MASVLEKENLTIKYKNIFRIVIVILLILSFASIFYWQIFKPQGITDISSTLEKSYPAPGLEYLVFELDENPEGKAIGLFTREENLKVFGGNEVIYSDEAYLEIETNEADSEMESVWHVIPLTNVNEGSKITIQMPYNDNFFEYMKNIQVIIGDEDKIYEAALSYSLITIVAAVFYIALAVVALLISLFWKEKKASKNIYILSAILLVLAIWTYGADQYTELQLFPINVTQNMYLGCAFVLPILILLALSNNVQYGEKIVCYIVAILLLGATIVFFALWLTGNYTINQMNGSVAIEFLISILVCIYAAIASQIRDKRQNKLGKTENSGKVNLFALGVFSAIIIVELSIYNFNHSYEAAIVTKIVSLLFFIHICIEQIGKGRSDFLIRTDAKAELLQMKNLSLIEKMKPHFIYNTLLSIQDLCYTNAKEAADVIGVFSKYLRFTLQIENEKSFVPIESEIQHIDYYIEIEKLCYENKIIYNKNVTVSGYWIPPLLIQPIVENAVKHGVLKRKGVGTIELDIWLEESDELVIKVKDDGNGYDVTTPTKKDRVHSAEIIEERLKNLVNGTIVRESAIGEGTLVTVRIPEASKYMNNGRLGENENEASNNG